MLVASESHRNYKNGAGVICQLLEVGGGRSMYVEVKAVEEVQLQG